LLACIQSKLVVFFPHHSRQGAYAKINNQNEISNEVFRKWDRQIPQAHTSASFWNDRQGSSGWSNLISCKIAEITKDFCPVSRECSAQLNNGMVLDLSLKLDLLNACETFVVVVRHASHKSPLRPDLAQSALGNKEAQYVRYP